MNDPRIAAHARILVRYCVAAREGQQVGVSGTSLAEPLLEAVCEEIYRLGAFPALRMSPPGLQEKLFRFGKDSLFATLPRYQLDYARRMDATIGVQSEGNTRGLTTAAPARMVALSKTMQPVRKLLMRKRWVTTLHPTSAYAQDAEMGLSDFEEYVYGAMYADARDPLAHWAALSRRQAGPSYLITRFGRKAVPFDGAQGTCLSFCVALRKVRPAYLIVCIFARRQVLNRHRRDARFCVSTIIGQ